MGRRILEWVWKKKALGGGLVRTEDGEEMWVKGVDRVRDSIDEQTDRPNSAVALAWFVCVRRKGDNIVWHLDWRRMQLGFYLWMAHWIGISTSRCLHWIFRKKF